MIPDSHLCFKRHARLEHQRLRPDEPQAQSLVDNPRLAKPFLGVVVKVLGDVSFGSDLEAVEVTNPRVALELVHVE